MAEKSRDQPKDAKQSAKRQPQGTGPLEMEGLEPIAVDPAGALQRAMPPPPAPLNPSDILSLQRAGGNRAVARLLAQRKRMTPPLQRQEEEEELQTKPADQTQRAAADAVPEVNTEMEDRIDAARGHGEPLPEDVREPMEQSLGADLGGVRIHADTEADNLSQSLQAQAFTTGQDVFFKSDKYKPDSSSGQKLIAHELTHVVQQGGGKTARKVQRSPDDPPVKPVKWYKLWYGEEKERQKYSTCMLMHPKKLEEKGGSLAEWKPKGLFGIRTKKKGAALYGQILNKLRQYHQLVEQYHAKMDPAPELFQKQVNELEELSSLIRRCRVQYEDWKESKKKARKDKYELLQTLEEQAKGEKTERLDKIRPWVTAKTVGEVRGEEGERTGGHVLEKVDPEHRDVHVLNKLYPKWQNKVDEEATQKEFFDWVTELEDNEDDLLLKVLHWRHQMADASHWGIREKDFAQWKPKFLEYKKRNFEDLIERTWYLEEKGEEEGEGGGVPEALQREEYELTFRGGPKVGGIEISLLGTKKFIFAMSPDGRFYAFAEEFGKTVRFFHHSSFLAGGAAGAAGKIEFDGGYITIDPESGHYTPGLQQMVNATIQLERHGVDLKTVAVHPWYGCTESARADDFLEGLRKLREPGAMDKVSEYLEAERSESRQKIIEQRRDLLDEWVKKVETYKGRNTTAILEQFYNNTGSLASDIGLGDLAKIKIEPRSLATTKKLARYFYTMRDQRGVLKKERKMLKKTTHVKKRELDMQKQFGERWEKNDFLRLVTTPAHCKWIEVSPAIQQVIL